LLFTQCGGKKFKIMIEKIRNTFYKKFNTKGNVYSAPGRVNLIGEHTDYNNGFVLPGAIDKQIAIEIAPNNSNTFNVFSIDFSQEISFEADGKTSEYLWANYIIGVIMETKKLGHHVPGFNCVFSGNIPEGTGMSSSAALECAFSFAINDLFKLKLTKIELAKIGQMSEHNYVGVRCGIMDQFASLFGEKDKLIKLDCQSLEYELIPFNLVDYKVTLIDTRVKHSLANSEYNIRRSQCEEGVEFLRKNNKAINSLRDVSIADLNRVKEQLPAVIYDRCSYVIEENERLLKACNFLKAGDIISFGEQMYKSHEGLSKKYEVSCEELDFLVDVAKKSGSVIGSRMMGGGFGGCTINLIKKENYKSFTDLVSDEFEKKFDRKPFFYDVNIKDGAKKGI